MHCFENAAEGRCTHAELHAWQGGSIHVDAHHFVTKCMLQTGSQHVAQRFYATLQQDLKNPTIAQKSD